MASTVLAAGGQGQQAGVPDAPAPQQNVPSAPTPQPTTNPNDSISGLASQAARGKASGTESGSDQQAAPAVPTTADGAVSQDGPPDTQAPYSPGNAQEAQDYLIKVPVNFVLIPVLVLDKNHGEVPGLTSRDFRVYENAQRQHISFFSVDAAPLSVAFVIDQSLPHDIMNQVNNSLAAVVGAFTPQDEVAVFTYANGVTEQTTFTAATGDRLPAVLSRSKRGGTDMGTAQDPSGPFGQGPTINNIPIDPNLTPQRSGNGFIIEPRETHTLNDAILAAGQQLARAKKGRRRIIYVISDGKESRSKAHLSEVVRFLQTNQEAVYATLVGESAVPIEGYIDKFHLPLLPYDNILPHYTTATGGELVKELSTAGMQRSFARIMDQVRTQYTIGYNTHLQVLDSRYRKLDVHVERPNLDVIAPPGYYPTATDLQR